MFKIPVCPEQTVQTAQTEQTAQFSDPIFLIVETDLILSAKFEGS